MSDVKVGDQIRLTKYEGYVGFGTSEGHAVYKTCHEGKVVRIGNSRRFGQDVKLEGCIAKHDEDDAEDDILYLDDYWWEVLAVHTCPTCNGRGVIHDQPKLDPKPFHYGGDPGNRQAKQIWFGDPALGTSNWVFAPRPEYSQNQADYQKGDE